MEDIFFQDLQYSLGMDSCVSSPSFQYADAYTLQNHNWRNLGEVLSHNNEVKSNYFQCLFKFWGFCFLGEGRVGIGYRKKENR